jgi:precorrin-6Y C5,15-methyltransferase (decarboxylating)
MSEAAVGDAGGTVTVVGTHGGEVFGRAAGRAIEGAGVVVGSARHLAERSLRAAQEQWTLRGPLDPIIEQIAAAAERGVAVCVLSSGDPGFFGIVRLLAQRLGSGRLAVHPAPSSVSLAFARAGVSWDDALVVSAHGRPLRDAIDHALGAAKVAVLTSPEQPPQLVGQALLDRGSDPRSVVVASRLGEPGEAVTRTDLHGLAAGSFDPMSVVLILEPASEPDSELGSGDNTLPSLAWGLAENAFEHRAGMITKSEVRAVALGKMALPRTGVVWDVGAGSGSVAIECARLSRGLRVFAIERSEADAAQITRNARTHGVRVTVVNGEAPDALAELPTPDRVFVGGGGLSVLEECVRRVSPTGTVVATHVLVDRADAAWRLLGNSVQVGVSRAVGIADGMRLNAENPVFISWGPT